MKLSLRLTKILPGTAENKGDRVERITSKMNNLMCKQKSYIFHYSPIQTLITPLS